MPSDDHDERVRGALAVALVVVLTYNKRCQARTLAEGALVLDVLLIEDTVYMKTTEVVPVSSPLGKSTHDQISPRRRGL